MIFPRRNSKRSHLLFAKTPSASKVIDVTTKLLGLHPEVPLEGRAWCWLPQTGDPTGWGCQQRQPERVMGLSSPGVVPESSHRRPAWFWRHQGRHPSARRSVLLGQRVEPVAQHEWSGTAVACRDLQVGRRAGAYATDRARDGGAGAGPSRGEAPGSAAGVAGDAPRRSRPHGQRGPRGASPRRKGVARSTLQRFLVRPLG